MKRREFIKDASLVGIATMVPLSLKVAAMEAITVEEKLSMLLKDMPIGGVCTVIKNKKDQYIIYGTGIEEVKQYK